MQDTGGSDADRAKLAADIAASRAEMEARMAAYEAKWDAFRQREAELLPGNRAALFAALAGAGVARVVVAFDGSGNSGQIESVTAYDAEDREIAIPMTQIEIRETAFESEEVSVSPRSADEVVEIMAYKFLEQTHNGWEENEGAYGEFVFTVADQSIRLEYNERYTDTHCHEHKF